MQMRLFSQVSINTQPLFTTSSTVGLPATHEKLASTLEQRPIAALPQTAHPAVSIAPIPSRPTAAVTPKMSGWTGSEEAGAAITSNSERPRLQEGLNYPSLPSWNKCRSFLTGAHLVQVPSTHRRSREQNLGATRLRFALLLVCAHVSRTWTPLEGSQEWYKPTDAAGATHWQGMGSSSSAHRQPIGTFPPNLQEMLLMDDLLYVMLGIEGKYIRAKPVGKSKVRSAFFSSSRPNLTAGNVLRLSPRLVYKCQPPHRALSLKFRHCACALQGSKSPVAFEVEPGMDPALHELVMQFLPLW